MYRWHEEEDSSVQPEACKDDGEKAVNIRAIELKHFNPLALDPRLEFFRAVWTSGK
jgi:hypothetical protein